MATLLKMQKPARMTQLPSREMNASAKEVDSEQPLPAIRSCLEQDGEARGVRWEKVFAIRAQLQAKTYFVHAEQVADSLLRRTQSRGVVS